jgi:hypothetical protein
MAAITESEEPENDNDEESEDTLIEEWESESEEVLYELHEFEGQDQVLVIGGPEEGDDEDEVQTVCIASGLKELDEAIEILTVIREKIAEKKKR